MATDTIVTAPEILWAKPNDKRRYSMDFADVLASGDALTGTPTVSISPTGPTLGTATVSGSQVRFTITSVTAGTDYVVVCKCGTTGGDTLEGNGNLLGRAN